MLLFEHGPLVVRYLADLCRSSRGPTSPRPAAAEADVNVLEDRGAAVHDHREQPERHARHWLGIDSAQDDAVMANHPSRAETIDH